MSSTAGAAPPSTDERTVTPPKQPWVVGARLAVAIALLGALMVATRPLIRPPGTDALPPLSVLAQTSGLLAGYGALVLLLLVARQPALERGIGSHVLARWHARLAPALLVLVLVHAVGALAAAAGPAQRRGYSLTTSSLRVLTTPWVAVAVVGTLLLLVVGITSVPAVRRTLSRERWHGLHLLTYLAVALGFGHQLIGPDLLGHVPLQVGWSLAYAYVFAALAHHRFLTPLRQSLRHRFQVTAVVPEGPGVVSITVGGRDIDALGARSGQFFRWRFVTPDHWTTAHPFSLSAPPKDDELRLTVAAVGDGSRRLQDVAVGTWVVAEGPYGAVTPERRTRRDVLMIAGGTGIAPVRALFESLPLHEGEDLLLLYRSRSAQRVLFRDELDAIAAARGARIVHSLGEDPSWLAAPALLAVAPDLAGRDVYLCGPPGMTAAARASLRAAGLPARHLHEERFTR